MHNDQPNHDDLVERAARELSQASIPEGPPESAVQQTVAALRKAADALDRQTRTRRFVMRTLTGLAASALIAGGVFYFTTAPSVAFADVAQKLRDARTLSFRSTFEVPGEKEKATSRTFYRDPSSIRREGPGQAVIITDLAAKRSLALNPPARTAQLFDLKAALPGQGHADEAAATISWLRQLAGETSKPLGTKLIDGIDARGFAVTSGGREWTVWADAKRGLPVRIEMTLDMLGQRSVVVMDQFVLDAPLDEKLFRLEAPEGYEVTKVELPAPAGGVVDEVVQLLRRYTARADGRFPAKLDDWGAYAVLVSAGSKDGKPSKEDIELMTGVGRLTALLAGEPPGSYGYAGAGVKMGDARQIVFWYRPKGAETYKAVLGNLEVTDVTEDRLPVKK